MTNLFNDKNSFEGIKNQDLKAAFPTWNDGKLYLYAISDKPVKDGVMYQIGVFQKLDDVPSRGDNSETGDIFAGSNALAQALGAKSDFDNIYRSLELVNEATKDSLLKADTNVLPDVLRLFVVDSLTKEYEKHSEVKTNITKSNPDGDIRTHQGKPIYSRNRMLHVDSGAHQILSADKVENKKEVVDQAASAALNAMANGPVI